MSARRSPGEDRHQSWGYPPAVPAAGRTGAATHQVSARAQRSRATNTPPLASSRDRTATPRRLGYRQLARITQELSDRDRMVLSYLAQHRYLTTHHLQAFVFTDHTSDQAAARTARRVLARLQRQGLIRPLERRVGGFTAGSAVSVWQLAPAGARAIAPATGRSWRTHQPSPRFLHHSLAVAEAHLELRRGADYHYQVTVQIEPASWRRFTGPGAEPRLVRPDLAARIIGQDQQGRYEDHWFLEIDMGTESLPTLLAKCRRYQDYYRTGMEQASHGAFPRVLWVLHGPRDTERHRALTQRLEKATDLERRLFRLATAHDLPQALWGHQAPLTGKGD